MNLPSSEWLDKTTFESSLAKQFASMYQYALGLFPTDARIGYRDPVLELGKVGRNLLATGSQITLQHEASDCFLTPADLVYDGSEHSFLSFVVLS